MTRADPDDPDEGTGDPDAYDGQAVEWLTSEEGQAEADAGLADLQEHDE